MIEKRQTNNHTDRQYNRHLPGVLAANGPAESALQTRLPRPPTSLHRPLSYLGGERFVDKDTIAQQLAAWTRHSARHAQAPRMLSRAVDPTRGDTPRGDGHSRFLSVLCRRFGGSAPRALHDAVGAAAHPSRGTLSQ